MRRVLTMKPINTTSPQTVAGTVVIHEDAEGQLYMDWTHEDDTHSIRTTRAAPNIDGPAARIAAGRLIAWADAWDARQRSKR